MYTYFIRLISLYFLLSGISSLAVVHAQAKCEGLLFATGFDKVPSHGSKDALITAVNRGEPIRIGWEFDFNDDGKADLTHWAEASFLSVWQSEVFTQIEAVHAQTPIRSTGNVTLRDTYTEWRGSLGTTGQLDGRYSNGAEFPSDLKSRIFWCSALPGPRGSVLLYRNGINGEDLAGSKDALFAAIRSGQDIQIGWGFQAERDGQTYSVEHLISPVFLSIVNGLDVSAQLPEHIAQRHYLDIDQAFFEDPAVMWRGLMTTKGTFDAVWVNRASGETIRRYPQRAALSWYASAAPDLSTPSLARTGGVTLDETRSDERYPE